jgi:CPA2 family monovalent cation:H+ antiporter-2
MSELLTAIAIVFAAAAALLFVATKLSLPTIPLYIVAGLLVGPFIEGQVLELAQWGIALLVFVFGVGIEPGRLGSVARDSYAPAIVQLVATGVAGYVIGLGLGFSSLNALYLGVAAALSSSLVGEELLAGEIYNDFINARLAQSVHFLQDLVAVVLVLLLGAATFTPEAIQSQLLAGGLLIGGALAVRYVVFDLLVRLSGEIEELLLLSSISVLMGFIGLAELLGVSIVVGAFAAGLAVASDFAESQAMLNGLESLNDFFAAIFFVSLGALVALPTGSALVFAAVLLVLTIVVKPLLVTLLFLRQGYDTRTASETGFNLDQISEWTLIIAIEALILGRILPDLFAAIVLVAAASMITSAYTHRQHDRVWELLDRSGMLRSFRRGTKAESHVSEGIAGHVILAGFGEQGQTAAGTETEAVGEACADLGIELVVIDNDPVSIADAKEQYDNYVYGDIFNPRTWERANASEALLIVSTMADRRISETILDVESDANRMLTATDTDEALLLLEKGAFYVNVPDVLAAEQLSEHLESVLTQPDYCDGLRQQNVAELQRRVS